MIPQINPAEYLQGVTKKPDPEQGFSSKKARSATQKETLLSSATKAFEEARFGFFAHTIQYRGGVSLAVAIGISISALPHPRGLFDG